MRFLSVIVFILFNIYLIESANRTESENPDGKFESVNSENVAGGAEEKSDNVEEVIYEDYDYEESRENSVSGKSEKSRENSTEAGNPDDGFPNEVFLTLRNITADAATAFRSFTNRNDVVDLQASASDNLNVTTNSTFGDAETAGINLRALRDAGHPPVVADDISSAVHLPYKHTKIDTADLSDCALQGEWKPMGVAHGHLHVGGDSPHQTEILQSVGSYAVPSKVIPHWQNSAGGGQDVQDGGHSQKPSGLYAGGMNYGSNYGYESGAEFIENGGSNGVHSVLNHFGGAGGGFSGAGLGQFQKLKSSSMLSPPPVPPVIFGKKPGYWKIPKTKHKFFPAKGRRPGFSTGSYGFSGQMGSGFVSGHMNHAGGGGHPGSLLSNHGGGGYLISGGSGHSIKSGGLAISGGTRVMGHGARDVTSISGSLGHGNGGVSLSGGVDHGFGGGAAGLAISGHGFGSGTGGLISGGSGHGYGGAGGGLALSSSSGHGYGNGAGGSVISGHGFGSGTGGSVTSGHGFGSGTGGSVISGHGFGSGTGGSVISGHGFGSGTGGSVISGHGFGSGTGGGLISGGGGHRYAGGNGENLSLSGGSISLGHITSEGGGGRVTAGHLIAASGSSGAEVEGEKSGGHALGGSSGYATHGSGSGQLISASALGSGTEDGESALLLHSSGNSVSGGHLISVNHGGENLLPEAAYLSTDLNRPSNGGSHYPDSTFSSTHISQGPGGGNSLPDTSFLSSHINQDFAVHGQGVSDDLSSSSTFTCGKNHDHNTNYHTATFQVADHDHPSSVDVLRYGGDAAVLIQSGDASFHDQVLPERKHYKSSHLSDTEVSGSDNRNELISQAGQLTSKPAEQDAEQTEAEPTKTDDEEPERHSYYHEITKVTKIPATSVGSVEYTFSKYETKPQTFSTESDTTQEEPEPEHPQIIKELEHLSNKFQLDLENPQKLFEDPPSQELAYHYPFQDVEHHQEGGKVEGIKEDGQEGITEFPYQFYHGNKVTQYPVVIHKKPVVKYIPRPGKPHFNQKTTVSYLQPKPPLVVYRKQKPKQFLKKKQNYEVHEHSGERHRPVGEIFPPQKFPKQFHNPKPNFAVDRPKNGWRPEAYQEYKFDHSHGKKVKKFKTKAKIVAPILIRRPVSPAPVIRVVEVTG